MESSSEVVPNTFADKSICVEVHVVNAKDDEGKVTFKEPVEKDTITVAGNVYLKNGNEQNELSSAAQKETEEIAEQTEGEEIEDDDDNENGDDGEGDEENRKRKIAEETTETLDDTQTKTIAAREGEPGSTNSNVTISSVTEDEHPTETTTHITEAVENPEHEEIKEKIHKTTLLKEEEEEDDTEEKEGEQVKQEVNVATGADSEKPGGSTQPQHNKNQISQQPETQSPPQQQSPTTETEETNVDAISNILQIHQPESNIPNKQEHFNTTIKGIITNIDDNIKAEENIAALKERELELLKKQQEITKEIKHQRLLAQKVANENQLKQQFYNKYCLFQKSTSPPKTYQSSLNVSTYKTIEENQENNVYSQKSETFETRESPNVTKQIDLDKIFTPATDTEEILPKNRKLYASSAFYSPTLHPTVEDQVELARRISHSLSDISNQKSRGQSMYVNRKKRSVKWVHEGCGQDYHQYQQQPRPSTSPSILPAYTDAARHRVQLNLHQEQLLEKYARPDLKVVQRPWEAALNSGSASAAFVEEEKLLHYFSAPPLTYSPTPQIVHASQTVPTIFDNSIKIYSADNYQRYPSHAAPQQQAHHERQQYPGTNSVRELAYKPRLPQGWKAPNMSLPKDLYMPKEIPLESYAPPPVVTIPLSISTNRTANESNQYSSYKPSNSSSVTIETTKLYGGNSTFPLSKSYQQGFSSTYGNSRPPKQQYLPPKSYQTAQQNTSRNIPQVNFNPSPLPYDKLAKFENQTSRDCRYVNSTSSCIFHLNVRGSKIRNISPAPLGSAYNRPYTPSSDSQYYGGTPSASPRPISTANQYYSGHNTPNISHPAVSSNQILNAPSYNNSARGWGCSGAATSGYQFSNTHMLANKPQIINAVSMPYTDY